MVMTGRSWGKWLTSNVASASRLRCAQALCVILWVFFFPGHAFAQNWIPQVDRSVVRILVGGVSRPDGTGSGWVIAKGGYIVTNRHVIDGSDRQIVYYRDAMGHTQSAEAQIVAQSASHDLVILKIDNVDLPPLVTSSTLPGKGSDVYALGFPGAADNALTNYNDENGLVESTVTSGKIGRIIEAQLFGPQDRQGYARTTWVQHSAAISGGNSGGPLFDSCGRVIAINTAGALGQVQDEHGTVELPQGIQWAAPIKSVLPLINDISEPISVENQTSVCNGQFAGVSVTPAAPASANDIPYWPIVGAIFLVGGALIGVFVLLRKPAIAGPANGPLVARYPVQIEGRSTDLWQLGGQTKAGVPVIVEARVGSRMTIGRTTAGGAFCIDDPTVSRRHLVVDFGPLDVTVQDLGSSNGTFLDGRPLGARPVQARPGQMLRIGSVNLLVGKSDAKSQPRGH
jgi:S1-C subfamily serine protease